MGEPERVCVALPGQASRRCVGKAKARWGALGLSVSGRALAVVRALGA